MGLRTTIFRLTPLGVLAGFSVSFDAGMLALRAAEPEFRVEQGVQPGDSGVTPVEGRLFNFGRFIPRLGDSSDSERPRPSPQPSRQYGSSGSLQPDPDSRYPAARSPSVSPTQPRSLPRAAMPFNKMRPQPSADTRANPVPPAPTFTEPAPSTTENATSSSPSVLRGDESELTPVPRRGSTPTRTSSALPSLNRSPEGFTTAPETVPPRRPQPQLEAPALTGPGLTPPGPVSEVPNEAPVLAAPSGASAGPTLTPPTESSTGEPAPFEPMPRRSESASEQPRTPPTEATVESTPMLQPIPRRVKEDFQPNLEPIPRRRIVDSNGHGTPMIPSSPLGVTEDTPPTRISIAPAPTPERPSIRPVPEFDESQGQPRQSARTRTPRPAEAQNQPSTNPLNRFGVNQLGENMRRMMLFRR